MDIRSSSCSDSCYKVLMQLNPCTKYNIKLIIFRLLYVFAYLQDNNFILMS
jgi:hypothetical protein